MSVRLRGVTFTCSSTDSLLEKYLKTLYRHCSAITFTTMASFKPSNPAIGRHKVPDFKTPDIRDLVFHLVFDTKLAYSAAPAYGSLYDSPDGQYATFELVYVTPADRNGLVKWYYAAPRSEQGAYNFEHNEPSASQGGFPHYTRTYLVKRDEVDEYFERSNDAVDIVQNLEFTISSTTATDLTDELFKQKGVFNGKPSYISVSGHSCYWNGSGWVIYIRESGALDWYVSFEDVATPDLASSWTAPFIPATSVSIVASTTDAWEGIYYLEAGDYDPDVPYNFEFKGFQYTSQTVVRSPDKELDSLYVLIRRKFEKLCPTSGTRINNITGALENFTVEVLPITDPRAVAIAPDEFGLGVSIAPINCNFVRRTEGQIIPFLTHTYTTYVNYSWPRVMDSIQLRLYSLNNGDERSFPWVKWKREAFSGPTLATVVETWYKTLPDPLPVAEFMVPNAIHYPSPVVNVNTGNCLHPNEYFVVSDIGSGDAKWGVNVGGRIDYGNSSHEDWPETLRSSVEVRPEQGGFIVRVVTLQRPDHEIIYPLDP